MSNCAFGLTTTQIQAELSKDDLGICGKCDHLKFENGMMMCDLQKGD